MCRLIQGLNVRHLDTQLQQPLAPREAHAWTWSGVDETRGKQDYLHSRRLFLRIGVEKLVEHGASSHHLPRPRLDLQREKLNSKSTKTDETGRQTNERALAKEDIRETRIKNTQDPRRTWVESGVHSSRLPPNMYWTASKQSPPEDVRMNCRRDSVASLRASSLVVTPGMSLKMHSSK